MRRIYEYAAMHPPRISWQEMYDIGFLAMPATETEVAQMLDEVLIKLADRERRGIHFGRAQSPRVLITGCPVGGDALKIYKIIEESGGLVVVPDSCTGMKCFAGDFMENTGNPIKALATRYLDIPCACMTPNNKRLTALSEIIEKFRPDAVVDFVLTACHSYNVESYKVGRHVTENHDLPYLKIESDYSDNDHEQIRTKIQALLELVEK